MIYDGLEQAIHDHHERVGLPSDNGTGNTQDIVEVYFVRGWEGKQQDMVYPGLFHSEESIVGDAKKAGVTPQVLRDTVGAGWKAKDAR